MSDKKHTHQFLHDDKPITSEEAVKMVTEFYGDEKAADVIEGLTATPPRYSGAVHKTGRITCKKIVAMLAILFSVAMVSQASQVQSNLFSLAVVNNTTNSGTPIIIGAGYLTPFTMFVQNTGLASTNALYVNFQVGTDTNNFTTIGMYRPTATNGTTEGFTLTNYSVTLYLRSQIVTTNSVTVGANVVKTQ